MAVSIKSITTANNVTSMNVVVPAGLVDPCLAVVITSCARTGTVVITDILMDGVSMNLDNAGIADNTILLGYEAGISAGTKTITFVTATANVTVRIVAYLLETTDQATQIGQSTHTPGTITPTKSGCFNIMASTGPFGVGSSTQNTIVDPATATSTDLYQLYDGSGYSNSSVYYYINTDTNDFDYGFASGTYQKLFEILRSLEPPIITTTPDQELLYSNRVRINATIDNDNGHAITERGIVYNTTGTPTTADTKVTVDGTTGAFVANMTGLDDNQIYYIRAYAINDEGTGYGPEINITTLPEQLPATTILN